MPNRTPEAPPGHGRAARIAFRSVRVSIQSERFELSVWDSAPLMLVVASLVILGPALFVAVPRWCAASLLVGAMIVCASARYALVVSPDAAWTEHRLVVVRRRVPLGRRPVVNAGIVWEWSEIAVTPSEPALRQGLHDDERAVLLQWGINDGSKDRDAKHLADLANVEIARLHA